MSVQRIVVIGGSAGAVEVLLRVVEALPTNFPAPICVVVHTRSDGPGGVRQLLGARGTMTANEVRNGERLEAGHIYVAPPDHHLLVELITVRLTRGPKENRFRPAIDPLFRSAAQAYGAATVGVVLSGNLDDGTAGLWAIKNVGGVAVVQDPADALFPSMPRSATAHVAVDHVVPAAQLAQLLARIVSEPVAPSSGAHLSRSLEWKWL